MENLLTYVIQVNLLLVIVYFGYVLLLKNLTFYTLNRVYFIIGALYALVYPMIDIKRWLVKDTRVAIPVLWDYVSVEQVEKISKAYSLYDFLLGAIGLGAFIFVFKLLVQLFSLIRIHFYSKDSKWHHFLFRDVLFPVVPFSFFNRIYLHKAQHQEVELQDIFEHESIHVKGHHTWDVLLFEMVLIGCWYNPFVWLMRNAVRQNLEYLTDQQVLNKGVDRQAYQYSLLNVTQRGAAVGISNQFNFKTLKKRIMMMNKNRSSRLELSKYAFLLPIMVLAGASFTVSQAETKIVEVVDLAHETKLIETNKPVVLNKVNADSVAVKSAEYPLLAPNFDKKALEKGNFYYEIDGKLVSLDDFLAFPRTEIYAVDIYKEKDEIQKKIGKANADGLFVMTSKKNSSDNTTKQDTVVLKRKEGVVRLGSKKAYSELSADERPLIVLDGVTQSDDVLNTIHPDNIKSVTVLKEGNATTLYGEKAKNGVILIETKAATKDNSEPTYEGKEKTVASNSLTVSGTKGDMVLIQQKEGPTKKIVLGRNPNSESPLFVVDGVVVKDLDDIDSNDIESMNVIKGQSAIDKYGDKASAGVVEIKLKSISNKPVISVKGSQKENSSDNTVKEVSVVGKKK